MLDLAGLAERVRRVTVEVMDGGAAVGAGVLWPPGVIVTNAHVARRPRLTLRLPDGRRVEARLLARDAAADLALLATPPTGLATAPIGDAARVGTFVVAVGHPFGICQAISAGIISAIGPLVVGGRPWIQADVRLAPGNSGGPLADAAGRVVGVNAMVAGGLALAIPSDAVARFVHERGTARV